MMSEGTVHEVPCGLFARDCVEGRSKMHHFAQTAYKHQDPGVAVVIDQKTEDIVETHRLPTVQWDCKDLQRSRRVAERRNTLTYFTRLHIPGNPLVLVGPPKGLGDRQEGLPPTKMSTEGRIMRLLKYIKLKILVVRDDDTRRNTGLHAILEQAICPLKAVEPGSLPRREPFHLGFVACSEESRQRGKALITSIR
ncbi:unnamed protein product [Phytophthora fragariaefolia]|uniref:Unnamed protein product n=1 Tax=Phytophthora fragariaefolia TaxID=1490495 RepID=A0A9W7D885_9STRA|nr:unnamed protein product [Phytophthora fragariaefolia]